MTLQPFQQTDLQAIRPASQRRTRLSDSARKRLQDSVPPETERAYKREWHKFLEWCLAHGEKPLPADTDTLTNWVADRCDTGDGLSAMKQGISGVLFAHDQANVPEKLLPETADAWRVLTQEKKARADAGHREVKAATYTVEELRLMAATFPPGRVISLRNRSILTLGTSSFQRRRTLSGLDITDLRFLGDGDIETFISHSKTDQAARGKKITVPPGGHELSDPVGTLAAWVEELAHQGYTSGPLLRPVRRDGKILDSRLSDHTINLIVKRAAQAAKLEAPQNTRWVAHSMRASGATAAAENGASFDQICDQGGWEPKSNQALLYVRPKKKNNAMRDVL